MRNSTKYFLLFGLAVLIFLGPKPAEAQVACSIATSPDPATGPAPLGVVFTPSENNPNNVDIDERRLDFGDGSTPIQLSGGNQQAFYRFNSQGTFTVKLELINKTLFSSVVVGSCQVAVDVGPLPPPPQANIFANGVDGPLKIPSQGNVALTWCDPAGIIPCDQANSCTIAKNGSPWRDVPVVGSQNDIIAGKTTYELRCINAAGTTTDSVTVGNTKPVASASLPGPSPIKETHFVLLSSQGSSDADGDFLTFKWRQTGGTTIPGLSDSTHSSPSFIAPLVGPAGDTLTFELVVNDGIEDSDPVTVQVPIQDVPDPLPIPDIRLGNGQKTATINEGSSIKVTWCDTTSKLCEHSTSCSVEKNNQDWQPSNPADNGLTGDYTDTPTGNTILYRLTCTGPGGTNTDSATVRINHTPTAGATAVPSTVNEGDQIHLSAVTSSDPDTWDNITSYQWTQTSGPSVTFDKNSPNPSFTAPIVVSPGQTLTFQLVVKDSQGVSSAPTTVNVQVNVAGASGSTSASRSTGDCVEVPLPRFPGAPDLDPCSSPAAYITYWFYASLYLASIAALLTLVAGGVVRVASGLSPSSIQKANRVMMNAALGLVLLFTTWIILNTLNPTLTTPQDPSLQNLEGCLLGFTPPRIPEGQSSTLSWAVFDTEGASKTKLICDDGTQEDHNKLSNAKTFNGAKVGQTACTLRALKTTPSGGEVVTQECHAQLVVEPSCGLSWQPGAAGSNKGTLEWTASQEAIRGYVSCQGAQTTNCPGTGPTQRCRFTGVTSGTLDYQKTSNRDTVTCTIQIERPWRNSCSLDISFP